MGKSKIKKRKKPGAVPDLPESSDDISESEDEEQSSDKYKIFHVPGYIRKYHENTQKTEFIVFLSHSDDKKSWRDSDRLALSKALRKYCVSGVMHLRPINKFKVGITFDVSNNANVFLQNKELLEELSLKASIPASDTEVTGVLTSVPVELSNKKIFSLIGSSRNVIQVRRFMRRVRSDGGAVSFEPTQTVAVTFASTQLPEYVYLDNWRHENNECLCNPLMKMTNYFENSHNVTFVTPVSMNRKSHMFHKKFGLQYEQPHFLPIHDDGDGSRHYSQNLPSAVKKKSSISKKLDQLCIFGNTTARFVSKPPIHPVFVELIGSTKNPPAALRRLVNVQKMLAKQKVKECTSVCTYPGAATSAKSNAERCRRCIQRDLPPMMLNSNECMMNNVLSELIDELPIRMLSPDVSGSHTSNDQRNSQCISPIAESVYQSTSSEDHGDCRGRIRHHEASQYSIPKRTIPKKYMRCSSAKIMSETPSSLNLKLCKPPTSQCSIAIQAYSPRCSKSELTSLTTKQIMSDDWVEGVRALRNSHVRLVLQQLQHIDRVNRTLDRAMRAGHAPRPIRLDHDAGELGS